MHGDRAVEKPQAAASPEATYEHYWAFYDAVAAAQLREWLPVQRSRVLDISGGAGRFATLISDHGHHVVHLAPGLETALLCALQEKAARAGAEQVRRVVGPTDDLGWIRPESFDAVVAESSALSGHLATEWTFAQLARLLRPGGRLLLCVDSLVLGLARLAEQGRWAELADVPSADLVLVPNEDGSITRCFWPEEVQTLLRDSGFDVDWIRPRSVLSPEAVDSALRANPESIATLVRTEVALAKDREGESVGNHLVASAHRREVLPH